MYFLAQPCLCFNCVIFPDLYMWGFFLSSKQFCLKFLFFGFFFCFLFVLFLFGLVVLVSFWYWSCPKTILCVYLSVFYSAGVGRTGTYIALDALYREGRNTGAVNVVEFVKKMRNNRVSMVQTYVCFWIMYF